MRSMWDEARNFGDHERHRGGGPSSPASWNRYSYAKGDPVNRHDPSGLDDCGSNWVSDASLSGPCLVDGYASIDLGGVYQEACDQMILAWGPVPVTDPVCNLYGAVPPTETAAQPACTLELFRRPAKFKGNLGQHTFLDLCEDGTDCEIVEGGRDNNKSDSTYGDLIGFINAPGTAGVLGYGTSHQSNPLTDTQLGSTQSIPCTDMSVVNSLVLSDYNFDPVKYAFLPNGGSTFNSNSFTYTLLLDLGLGSYFGPYPTNILGGRLFYPGWGYAVPGLLTY
jgi:hypothetical protein